MARYDESRANVAMIAFADIIWVAALVSCFSETSNFSFSSVNESTSNVVFHPTVPF